MTSAQQTAWGPVRLRVRYAKRGRLRFTSHRDIQRAFERAIRRADVPIAYSVGFSPHPKVSYLGAASTGTASEAEYLELVVTAPVDVDLLRDRLDAALPDGLDVVEVVTASAGSLADRVDASMWEVRFPGVPVETLQSAIERFLAQPEVLVERVLKDGRRQLDARAPIVRAETAGDADCAILQVVVRHVTPTVRPDDVLTGLRLTSGVTSPVAPLVTRLAQGRLGVTGRVDDPLTPDRVGSGPDGAGTGAVR